MPIYRSVKTRRFYTFNEYDATETEINGGYMTEEILGGLLQPTGTRKLCSKLLRLQRDGGNETK